ncbi:alpha/beta hydrolase [Cellvibrio mixtus]|uniref:alpha/beta hydrolase n=1 Tax=Cellvibrio mixtus TaxID=39650 RepID=UPI000587B6FB|nr:alpha/beta hydrolase-fold protein [Cellvibrio mixtus]
MKYIANLSAFFLMYVCLALNSHAENSRIEELIITSTALDGNLIGLNPERKIRVYLPASYARGKHKYPVIYYFHSLGWSNQKLFADGKVQRTLDDAIKNGKLIDCILVAGDFTGPGLGSFYGNAPSSGRWMDHITRELIPTIDQRFRTHKSATARAAIGDMIGAYAAIKLAMDYPGLFGSVYAMHPFGTATGETLMLSRPDWKQMNAAKNWADLESNIYSRVFMLMAQAYLPNPDKPPFYADLMVEQHGNQFIVNAKNVALLQQNFLLDARLPTSANNLRQLKGFKMDWGRYDDNPDHVYANQKFTRALDDFGVIHQAEEYSGNAWNQYWEGEERFKNEIIPFLNRHLRSK